MASFNNNDFKDEFDIDLNGEPSKGIVAKVGSTIWKFAKSAATGALEGTVSQITDDFQPAKDILDEMVATVDDFESLKDDIGKDLSTTINELRVTSAKLVPKVKNFIPGPIYKKMEAASQEIIDEAEGSVSKSPEQREAEYQESKTSSALARIFGKQQKYAKLQFENDVTNKFIDRKLESVRFKQSHEVAVASGNNIIAINTFLQTTFTEYLSESLKLKFASYYASKDTLHVLKTLAAMTKDSMNRMVINTGLPDRIKDTEYKRAHPEKKAGSNRDFITSYFSQFRKNIADKIKGYAEALPILGSFITNLDMLGDEPITWSDVGSAALKTGVKWYTRHRVRKTFKDNEALADVFKYLPEGLTRENMAMQLAQLMSKYKGGYGNAMSWLADLAPEMNMRRDIKNVMINDPSTATNFDNMTRQTIVEIIPAHLAHIGKFTEGLFRALAPNAPEPDTPVYNLKQRKLTTASVAAKDIIQDRIVSDKDVANLNETTLNAFKRMSYNAGHINVNAKTPEEIAEDKRIINDINETYETIKPDLTKFVTNSAYYLKQIDIDELAQFAFTGVVTPYIEEVTTGIDNPQEFVSSLLTLLRDKETGKIDSRSLMILNNELTNRAMQLNIHDKVESLINEQGQSNVLSEANLFENGKLKLSGLQNIYDKYVNPDPNKEVDENDIFGGNEELRSDMERDERFRQGVTKARVETINKRGIDSLAAKYIDSGNPLGIILGTLMNDDLANAIIGGAAKAGTWAADEGRRLFSWGKAKAKSVFESDTYEDTLGKVAHWYDDKKKDKDTERIYYIYLIEINRTKSGDQFKVYARNEDGREENIVYNPPAGFTDPNNETNPKLYPTDKETRLMIIDLNRKFKGKNVEIKLKANDVNTIKWRIKDSRISGIVNSFGDSINIKNDTVTARDIVKTPNHTFAPIPVYLHEILRAIYVVNNREKDFPNWITDKEVKINPQSSKKVDYKKVDDIGVAKSQFTAEDQKHTVKTGDNAMTLLHKTTIASRNTPWDVYLENMRNSFTATVNDFKTGYEKTKKVGGTIVDGFRSIFGIKTKEDVNYNFEKLRQVVNDIADKSIKSLEKYGLHASGVPDMYVRYYRGRFPDAKAKTILKAFNRESTITKNYFRINNFIKAESIADVPKEWVTRCRKEFKIDTDEQIIAAWNQYMFAGNKKKESTDNKQDYQEIKLTPTSTEKNIKSTENVSDIINATTQPVENNNVVIETLDKKAESVNENTESNKNDNIKININKDTKKSNKDINISINPSTGYNSSNDINIDNTSHIGEDIKSTKKMTRRERKAAERKAYLTGDLKWEHLGSNPIENNFHADFVSFANDQLSMMSKLVEATRSIKGGGGNIYNFKSGGLLGGLARAIGGIASGSARLMVGTAANTIRGIGTTARLAMLPAQFLGSLFSPFGLGFGLLGSGIGHLAHGMGLGFNAGANLLRGVANLGGSVIRAGGSILGGALAAPFGTLGLDNTIGRTGVGIKNLFNRFRKRFVDVYRVDKIEDGPILTAKEQEKGVYFQDRTPLKASQDITAPIFAVEKDKDGNDQFVCVISGHDIEVGLCDVKGQPLKAKYEPKKTWFGLGKSFGGGLLGGILGLGAGLLNKGFGLGKWLLGKAFGGAKKVVKVGATMLGRMFGIDTEGAYRYREHMTRRIDQIYGLLSDSYYLGYTKKQHAEEVADSAVDDASEQDARNKKFDKNKTENKQNSDLSNIEKILQNIKDKDKNGNDITIIPPFLSWLGGLLGLIAGGISGFVASPFKFGQKINKMLALDPFNKFKNKLDEAKEKAEKQARSEQKQQKNKKSKLNKQLPKKLAPIMELSGGKIVLDTNDDGSIVNRTLQKLVKQNEKQFSEGKLKISDVVVGTTPHGAVEKYLANNLANVETSTTFQQWKTNNFQQAYTKQQRVRIGKEIKLGENARIKHLKLRAHGDKGIKLSDIRAIEREINNLKKRDEILLYIERLEKEMQEAINTQQSQELAKSPKGKMLLKKASLCVQKFGTSTDRVISSKCISIVDKSSKIISGLEKIPVIGSAIAGFKKSFKFCQERGSWLMIIACLIGAIVNFYEGYTAASERRKSVLFEHCGATSLKDLLSKEISSGTEIHEESDLTKVPTEPGSQVIDAINTTKNASLTFTELLTPVFNVLNTSFRWCFPITSSINIVSLFVYLGAQAGLFGKLSKEEQSQADSIVTNMFTAFCNHWKIEEISVKEISMLVAKIFTFIVTSIIQIADYASNGGTGTLALMVFYLKMQLFELILFMPTIAGMCFRISEEVEALKRSTKEEIVAGQQKLNTMLTNTDSNIATAIRNDKLEDYEATDRVLSLMNDQLSAREASGLSPHSLMVEKRLNDKVIMDSVFRAHNQTLYQQAAAERTISGKSYIPFKNLNNKELTIGTTKFNSSREVALQLQQSGLRNFKTITSDIQEFVNNNDLKIVPSITKEPIYYYNAIKTILETEPGNFGIPNPDTTIWQDYNIWIMLFCGMRIGLFTIDDDNKLPLEILDKIFVKYPFLYNSFYKQISKYAPSFDPGPVPDVNMMLSENIPDGFFKSSVLKKIHDAAKRAKINEDTYIRHAKSLVREFTNAHEYTYYEYDKDGKLTGPQQHKDKALFNNIDNVIYADDEVQLFQVGNKYYKTSKLKNPKSSGELYAKPIEIEQNEVTNILNRKRDKYLVRPITKEMMDKVNIEEDTTIPNTNHNDTNTKPITENSDAVTDNTSATVELTTAITNLNNTVSNNAFKQESVSQPTDINTMLGAFAYYMKQNFNNKNEELNTLANIFGTQVASLQQQINVLANSQNTSKSAYSAGYNTSKVQYT